MKKYVFIKVLALLFCSSGCSGFQPQHYRPPVKPHRHTLHEMFGVTGGTNWDSEIKKDSFPGRIFANARMFYLQEKDFGGKKPGTYQPEVFREGARWGGFGENYYRSKNWKARIPYLIHSWETVGKWPDKWYTCSEWGDIEKTVYRYTQNYLATFCPKEPEKDCLVDLLEIGNEPWGPNTPGPECFARILNTVIRAGDDYYGDQWRLKLSAPAFQNSKPDSRINDYIGNMLPPEVIPRLSAISGHFYAFEQGTHHINQPPESPKGHYREFIDLVAWRDSHAPSLDLNITETGWNSHTIGEKAQAAYLLRALLLGARYGVNKLIFYELYDQPGVPIYSSCGLIDANHRPKTSYFIIRDFLARYGSYRFESVLSEEDVYVFRLSDGTKLLYLAWDGGPFTETGRPVEVDGKTITVSGMPKAVPFDQ